jgi:hypothetical protein
VLKKIKNKNKMNKSTIEKYFSGETSKKEELEILQYFTSENIAPELTQYQDYFRSLAALKTHANSVIPEDNYDNVDTSAFYIKRFGVALAVAASVALFLLFFPFFHKNDNFVVINGKKYTDEKRIELAFHASLENVKLDMKHMFDDFDSDLFN